MTKKQGAQLHSQTLFGSTNPEFPHSLAVVKADSCVIRGKYFKEWQGMGVGWLRNVILMFWGVTFEIVIHQK